MNVSEWLPLFEFFTLDLEDNKKIYCLCSRVLVRNYYYLLLKGGFSRCEEEVVKNKRIDLLNVEWEKYWAENGENLIWNSWIEKYKNYINPQYYSNTEKEINEIVDCQRENEQDLSNLDDNNDDGWTVIWQNHWKEQYNIEYNRFLSDNLNKVEVEVEEEEEEEEEIYKDSHEQIESDFSTEEDSEDYQSALSSLENEYDLLDKIQDEYSRMKTMDLPVKFGKEYFKNNEKTKSSKSVANIANIQAIKSAFKLVSVNFDEGNTGKISSGNIKYLTKNIKKKNRQLKMHKPTRHLFYDDDGNVIQNTNTNEIENDNENDDYDDRNLIKMNISEEDDQISQEETIKDYKRRKNKGQMKRKTKGKKKKLKLPSEIESNQKLKKYWQRRFSLFSKFDLGIKLDEESWFSVSPEKIAENTAKRCKCDVIIDGFCGAGGNAIQFALTCNRVIAIDIDPQKLELAKNNAQVYGVADRIEFILGDFFQLAESLRGDVVFLSPPWGGPSYLSLPSYDLEKFLQPQPVSKLLQTARKITENVVIYLPKNSNTFPLLVSAGEGKRVEIEQNFLNNRLVAVTAYYNELIRNVF